MNKKTNNSYTGEELAVLAARAANDTRAENITILDLRGMSPVTDYFVICSGTSDRQMRAVFDNISEDVRKRFHTKPFGAAGYDSPTWMLLDFVDVVIHIFDPDYRRFYDLELMWGDAPRVEWQDDDHQQ